MVDLLEPKWCKASPRLRHEVADEVWHWLVDTGSLTARLKSLAADGFEVRVIRLDRERPMWSERQALGIPDRRQALIRHVLLLGNGQPWVFARTVIPVTSLDGDLRYLAYLKERPLGAALFANHDLSRGEVEIAAFEPSHTIFKEAFACAAVCVDRMWGRRSVFELGGRRLLVSEIFLPGITDNLMKS